VILVSSDRRVLEMGLIYARNAVAQKWMEDARVFFFGPSEVTIATDPDLHGLVRAIIDEGVTPKACKWCSDKYSVSDLLEALGCVVEYIGSPVSESIREGHTPMTW
jgi:hypothetical protein